MTLGLKLRVIQLLVKLRQQKSRGAIRYSERFDDGDIFEKKFPTSPILLDKSYTRPWK